jgi:PAS domain S-box-containing protein
MERQGRSAGANMNSHHSSGSPVAELVGKIGLHDHLCIVYETQDEQLSAAIPFIKIGLERGEKCVYIADGNTTATLMNAMRGQEINVDAAVRQGSLTITNKGIYPLQGDFDPARWIELIEEVAREAKSAGFSAVRLTGEMTWVTGTDPRPERLIEFEAKFNNLARDHNILGICHYNARRFPPEVIRDMLHTHPTVVYRGCICENPYYVPPDEFLRPQNCERELHRMLARMQDDTANRERLRQSEERIRRSSEQHQKETCALIDTIPQQIWSGPADGTLDFCNERWRSYVGLSLDELQGDGWQSMLHPDDRERVLKAWHESVESGTPYEQEERHRGADGEYRWFLARGVPMRNAEGSIVRWYGTNTDIEDHKRAEMELRRGQVYLDMGQRIAGIGTWAWNPSSGEMFGSQEFYHILGIDPQSTKLTRETFVKRIHPADRPGYEREISTAVTQKRDWDIEYRIVQPKGTVRHIRGIGHPILNEDDTIFELIGTAMDITARKQTEEEVRRLSGRLMQSRDEERRRIARELHDSTGQDLVALATMLGQLRRSIPSTERKSRRILSEGKALADKCIREVRTLSYVLHPPVLDQAGIVGALRDHVKGFTARSGIDVQLEPSPDVGRMAREVELALFRVVQESLTNIQRHSRTQHAKIRIDRNPDLMLEISDSGCGASGSLPGRTSEPPFQFGVGIPSMQERVNLIGGRLEINSTSSGTIVRVTIPLGDEREKSSHSTS